MKLLLLGATGRTGKHILTEALAKNYQVTCLSRNAHRLPHHVGLTIIEGDPLDEEVLTEAISGCDAIINALNISRTSDFPWAKLRTPKNYLSDVMRQLAPIAGANSVDRLVVCSAWGVAETSDDIPGWFKWFIDHSNIGVAYSDHEKQERIITDSKLKWTIVRPVGLTNGKKQESAKVSVNNQPKPSILISRKTVAKFMVDALANDALIGQKVVISKA
ncbi:NAD(P)-dependent oxidoreductase [Roseivirga misakiensis]|uniref:NAD(P)-binding domain-containing protein n=1 Tax=Roseivirga misakiensis TaxID=1563681 RepID=A0A1E5T0F1_9BACT|nr:NAD(P)-binding oxidoreductase [Roseivirga misakiensis]OEK04836.1 hypothetical protein BFP71_15460 [Roseivirga misakiensis]